MGQRERLALFNSLGDVAGYSVLDLFAGSGALGIEALSRGARKVVFVDKNTRLITILCDTLAAFNALGNVELYGKSVQVFFKENQQKFDLVFADPPYGALQAGFLADIPNVLKTGGTFVLSNPVAVSPEIPGLELISAKKYAGCQLNFYRRLPDA